MRARLALLLGLSAISCRYDPVAQDVVDDLGPETGETGPLHRPGQPCLACHSKYVGATPFAVGGTVFQIDADGNLAPAAGVQVQVRDSAGDFRNSCTNAAGNFYVEKDKWKEVAFPLTVKAGSKRMRSLIGRDGSCGTCHRLPTEASIDPVTGADQNSAGVVLVDVDDVDQCQGAPL